MRASLLALLLIGCHHEPAASPARAPVAVAEAAPEPPKGDPVRGEYVATISGCVTCHTARRAGAMDMQQAFAGGMDERMIDGTVWRAPNITPDRETGIGAWTDAQLITAIRRGVRPDGRRLMPVMPYPQYHAMTDADAQAVVAYLRAQRPIANRVPRSDQLTLAPVALDEPRGNADPADPRGHGAYVASLMHCAACHTLHDDKPFAGGMVFRLPHDRMVTASNITSDPETGIGSWTEDQIVLAVRTMRHPRGMAIEGPMALYGEAWTKLTDGDATALAAYIHALAPVKNAIPDRFTPVTMK